MTIKQKAFVQKYLTTGNGTQAALEAYNTKDANTAAAIASENLRKPHIQKTIDEILSKRNLSLEKNIANVIQIATQKPETRITADQILKANLELIRLRGADQGKKSHHISYSLKAELSKMSYQELKKSYEERDKEIKELMDA